MRQARPEFKSDSLTFFLSFGKRLHLAQKIIRTQRTTAFRIELAKHAENQLFFKFSEPVFGDSVLIIFHRSTDL